MWPGHSSFLSVIRVLSETRQDLLHASLSAQPSGLLSARKGNIVSQSYYVTLIFLIDRASETSSSYNVVCESRTEEGACIALMREGLHNNSPTGGSRTLTDIYLAQYYEETKLIENRA